MADINDDKKASSTIRIVGGDEDYAADVVLDFDGKQKLLVKSDGSISSALRIVHTYDQDIILSDTTYYTIYNQTGVLTLSGFFIEFDDKKVYVKLTIDGVVIFDINCEKLKDILDWNQSPQPQTYISWNDGLKVFYFTPNFPIKSNSSINISARSKTGQVKKYKSSIIQVG